jgi:hypothetical protein
VLRHVPADRAGHDEKGNATKKDNNTASNEPASQSYQHTCLLTAVVPK